MPRPIRYKHGWRVNFIHRGTRHRRKFRDRKQAEEYIEAVKGGADTLAPLAELVQRYLHWSEFDKEKSSAWVASCRQMLGVFLDHLPVTRAEQIRPEHIRSFRSAFARNPKRSAATWEKYRQAISAFLNWGHRRDSRIYNVAADPELKIKVQQRRPQTFSRDELALIFKWCDSQPNPVWPVAFRLLVATGMRLGEMLALRWTDFDFNDTPSVSVTAGKTKTSRTVPLDSALLPIFKGLRKGRLLFDDGSGHPAYDRHTYHRILQRACVTVDIPQRPIHALRHTFARFFIESGGDLPMLKQLMGHRDIRTTMIYAEHFAIERAREAINRMGLP